ncbi:MAG TPA: hypothetical protein VK158_04040, partial [Acidobacteriota bacterium]|nr:hypothetical protein [Acidobacteriota bacterium]
RRRRVYGGDYWGKKILRSMHNGHDYCIEGIRNPEEVVLFKKNPYFRLIAVYAPDEERMKRLLTRGRPGDPKTPDEFKVHDLRDKGLLAGSSFGQNTALTVPMAHYTISNDGSAQELEERVKSLLTTLRQELR